jgi:acetyltransferase-like isoleucine patch superfamily enzyme
MEVKKIHIIGSGTLAKLIVEIIESTDYFEVGGFFSDDFPHSVSVLGYPVIGKFSDISNFNSLSLAIGVGEPKFRKAIFERELKKGHTFPPMVHSSVVLSRFSTIEQGVIIGPNSSVLNGSLVKHGSCVLSHVNINQDVIIDPYCLIAAGVVIGNNARIGEGAHVGLGIIIKKNQILKPWTYYSDQNQVNDE